VGDGMTVQVEDRLTVTAIRLVQGFEVCVFFTPPIDFSAFMRWKVSSLLPSLAMASTASQSFIALIFSTTGYHCWMVSSMFAASL
jgi:hypothetical protein